MDTEWNNFHFFFLFLRSMGAWTAMLRRCPLRQRASGPLGGARKASSVAGR